ncbi:MAG TPA: amino acid permease [Terriglobales bacterium]|jgi:APA family basic amino acid/polyamine antiporter
MPSAPPNATAADSGTGAIKALGLTSSTTIVMGVMIGSGIFVVSPQIARQVGSPAMLMLVWTLTGIMTMMGALCYGELAAAMPQAGGQYVYLREAFSPLFGFLYGWTSFVVIQTGTIAAVCVAFAKYLGVIYPGWISETNWLFHVGHIGPVQLGVNTEELVAIAVIVFLTWLNSRGVKAGALVQNVFTFAKIAALVGLILIGLVIARNAGVIAANFSHFWSQFWAGIFSHGSYNLTGAANGSLVSTATIVAVFAAMVGSLFSSDAWNNITFTAGEVQNPRRNLPLSLALGTITVTAIYLLTNLAYLSVLRFTDIAGAPEDRVASAMLAVLYGHTGAVLIAAAILISTFGCTNGLILAGARIYYAMANDGLFFKGVARLNPARVPARGLWIQGLWACLLCLSGKYNDLLNYVMFAVFLFYILTIAGLFILRYRQPDLARPYKVIGYPVLPALYILLAIFFDVVVLWVFPQYAGGGLLLVLLGVPVFYIWRAAGGKGLATTL